MNRQLVVGDYVECTITLDQGDWYKGTVYGVRDTDFDVKFDPPASSMKIGAGLFHKHHEGVNWRYDPNPPQPAVEVEAEPAAAEVVEVEEDPEGAPPVA